MDRTGKPVDAAPADRAADAGGAISRDQLCVQCGAGAAGRLGCTIRVIAELLGVSVIRQFTTGPFGLQDGEAGRDLHVGQYKPRGSGKGEVGRDGRAGGQRGQGRRFVGESGQAGPEPIFACGR